MARFSRIGCYCLIIAGVGLSLSASAGNIVVQNNSFENPPAQQPVSLTTDNWTLNGSGTLIFVPGIGNVPGGAGVFPNPANPNDGSPGTPGQPYSNGHLDGADGNDVAYLFSNVGNSITQALVDPNTSQPITFTGGVKYTLTASVAYAEQAPPATDRLAFELYYMDGNGQKQIVQEGDLSNATASPAINQQTLQDYSFTGGLLLGNDPAVGQQINVGFFTLDNGGGQFDLDNVRLSAVPEPASLGLLSLLGVGLARRRRA